MFFLLLQIFKEEVYDLLDPNPPAFPKADGMSLAKVTGPARAPIQIRETVNGGITLAGVTEAEVRTKEEMASFLLRGSVSRATGSTNMNSQSRCVHHLNLKVLFNQIHVFMVILWFLSSVHHFVLTVDSVYISKH